MKLCWDNIENLCYSKRTGKWYMKKHRSIYSYVYIDSCKTCGEPFLGRCVDSLFCSNSCAGSFNSEGERNSMYNKKEEKSSNWKGGVTKKNIPLYDTYAHQIDWCEEVRRNADDPNVLEVKCTHCGKWYVPKLYDVKNRIRCLNGNENSNYEGKFYCSTSCKSVCPVYNKTPQVLMKEDAVRAGRLKWIKMSREVQHELREMVLARDNHTCRKCGATDKPLHCHHIEPVAVNPIESADMDNCITLCTDCHKEAHSKDGCRYGQLRSCIEYA
jgi:5-methylcytosine-specific restriction endonuclease McrA